MGTKEEGGGGGGGEEFHPPLGLAPLLWQFMDIVHTIVHGSMLLTSFSSQECLLTIACYIWSNQSIL